MTNRIPSTTLLDRKKQPKDPFGYNASVLFPHTNTVALFLPFQNGENIIFTAKTVAQRNCPIFAKQAKHGIPTRVPPPTPTVPRQPQQNASLTTNSPNLILQHSTIHPNHYPHQRIVHQLQSAYSSRNKVYYRTVQNKARRASIHPLLNLNLRCTRTLHLMPKEYCTRPPEAV